MFISCVQTNIVGRVNFTPGRVAGASPVLCVSEKKLSLPSRLDGLYGMQKPVKRNLFSIITKQIEKGQKMLTCTGP